MFDATLDSRLPPGSNFPGDVPGANWRFLLPRLEFSTILCIGMPRAGTLEALAAMGQHVFIDAAPHRERRAAEAAQPRHLANVTLLADGSALLDDREIDLLFVVDGKRWQKLACLPQFRDRLVGILAAGAALYADWPVAGQICTDGLKYIRNCQIRSVWLTPLQGEMQTAVPYDNSQPIRYFLDQQLTASSLTIDTIKAPFRQRFRREGTRVGSSTKRRFSKDYPRLVRSAGHALLSLAQKAERLVSRPAIFARRGVLIGPQGSNPPEYLCRIAEESGVNIRGCRWGVVARGTFRSRKVLFLLFDPSQERPSYIVKLPLDPHFNYRLEIECRALRDISRRLTRPMASFPRVAFFGSHAGRTILGQTFVQGIEYARAQRIGADMPLLDSVVDTLMDLGAATAMPVPDDGEFATNLEQLWKRFLSIYSLSIEHREFLEEQLRFLSAAAASCPLVFQHGDPHCTNILAGPKGEISLIDWEAAQPMGMPLWDLLHFLRAHCMHFGRARSVADQLRLFVSQILAPTSFNQYWIAATQRYCDATNTPRELVRPLFYTCWIHRAVREASQLAPDGVHLGHYVNLLQRCIDASREKELSRLLLHNGCQWSLMNQHEPRPSDCLSS